MTRYGEVDGLPAPRAGVTYIVSRVVAEAAREREDLLVPGGLVRDGSGRVLGCLYLTRLGEGGAMSSRRVRETSSPVRVYRPDPETGELRLVGVAPHTARRRPTPHQRLAEILRQRPGQSVTIPGPQVEILGLASWPYSLTVALVGGRVREYWEGDDDWRPVPPSHAAVLVRYLE